MYYEEEGCRDCGSGATDYGYEMSDVRNTLVINNCVEGDEACENGDCDCKVTIKVTIRRYISGSCESCGDYIHSCVYDLSLDGTKIKTFKSESDADAYAAKVFPTAEAPERDYAWESEAGLRRAEGWG
jgi:hypothetical protein